MAKRPICKIDGCGKQTHAKGFCNTHYTKHRILNSKGCKVTGCKSPARSLGMCNKHYKKALAADGRTSGPKHGELLDFARWVASAVGAEGCIIWPYGDNGSGYGTAIYEGKPIGAHRLVCILAHGLPPFPEAQAAHSCGKGHEGCVNPDHLRWATASENAADKIAHGTSIAGIRHPLVKLSEQEVREIRLLAGTMTQRDIGAAYGVTREAISDIVTGRNWSHLD